MGYCDIMKEKKDSDLPTPRLPMQHSKRSKQRKSRSIKPPSSSVSSGSSRQKSENLLLMKLPTLFRLPDDFLNDILDQITPKLISSFGDMNEIDALQFFEYANILRSYKRLNRRLRSSTNEDKIILDAMCDGAFSCRILANVLINSFLIDTLNFRRELKNLMGRIRSWSEELVKAKILFKGIARSGEKGIPVNRKLYPTYYYYSIRDNNEDIEREVLSYYRSLGYMLGRIGDKSKTIQKKYEQLEELSFDTSLEGETLNELILENELLKKTQRKGMKVRIVREGVKVKKEGVEREREQREKLRKKVKVVQKELHIFLATNQKRLNP